MYRLSKIYLKTASGGYESVLPDWGVLGEVGILARGLFVNK
ncbi:hypothetical protein SBF1_5650002 [Candidatus Desulfosporosinus infrequens]|uniref:Uncharacterized protein n=1 Tax=Candidatus Desulfosporosinus infrequens TaxID=2043169 RepID=A0A2U3LKJ5_9FIRM|nr:hypothetical protein SBF1_5650002 [Candidatus Desulfosporosinus infrequens]